MTSQVNCDYNDLSFNEACVNVKVEDNNFNKWLYELSTDCVSCPYKRIEDINNITKLKVQTAKSLIWRIFQNNGSVEYISAQNTSDLHCELHPQFDEFGLYDVSVNKFGCDVTTVVQPPNSFLHSDFFPALYIAIGIIVVTCLSLSAARLLIGIVKRKCVQRNDLNHINEENSSKRRIRSIDTVRGISILVMIFVNDGAGGYPVLGHATWNGLLMGDLVFPCFMWIMGLCIPLSLAAQLARGASRFTISSSIIKRSMLLFLFGIALNTLGTDARLESIRIFGVLQRFSIAYILTALIYTLKIRRKQKEITNAILKVFADVHALFSQWLVVLIVVATHYGIMFYLPVPGCPKGYIGPGGRHLDGKYVNCSGGAAGYIDRHLLGFSHVYQYAEIVTVYGSQPFDPEGVLGCLTSVFQTFLGVQTGQIILCYKDWRNRVTRWLFWAFILGCVGSVLHFSDTIPVNKNLWSISFVLVTTCFCLTLFTACYLLIDVMGVWQGGPFRIPGMNALVMYVGHQLCFQIFPFHWKIGRMNTHTWLLAENLWGVILWTIIAYILHHKRVYINL